MQNPSRKLRGRKTQVSRGWKKPFAAVRCCRRFPIPGLSHFVQKHLFEMREKHRSERKRVIPSPIPLFLNHFLPTPHPDPLSKSQRLLQHQRSVRRRKQANEKIKKRRRCEFQKKAWDGSVREKNQKMENHALPVIFRCWLRTDIPSHSYPLTTPLPKPPTHPPHPAPAPSSLLPLRKGYAPSIRRRRKKK